MNKKNISPSSIHPVNELEKIELSLSRIIVDENRGALAVMTVEDRKVVHLLPQNEGTILTFVKSGCEIKSRDVRIPPLIYRKYINDKESLGFNLEKCVIEGCTGDIYYAREHWKHRRTKIDMYAPCSFGDAIILSTMCKTKMYVVRKMLNELEPLSTRLQSIIENGGNDD